jgi:hypothetical protein
VIADLQKIIGHYEAEEAAHTKHMSEEALAQRHNKRPAGIRKVENLIDRMVANKPGTLINNREIP